MRLVFVIAATLSLQACADRNVYDTPIAQGKVVDARSDMPIAGACIEVLGPTPARACTDDHGEFGLNPVTHRERTLVIGPIESIPPDGRAEVTARGFKTRTIQLGAGVSLDLRIRLEPMD